MTMEHITFLADRPVGDLDIFVWHFNKLCLIILCD